MDLLIYFLVLILIIYFLVSKDLDFKHNKANIPLNKIKRPKHDNYLVGFYIGYLKGIKSGNVLFELKDDTFIVKIENRLGLQEYILKKEEIASYSVKIDAYYTQKDVAKYGELDCSEPYFDSYVYESGKTLKIRKAYFMELILKNGDKMEIIFFNNPNFLLKDLEV